MTKQIIITPRHPVVTKKNRAYWDSKPLLFPTKDDVQAATQRGKAAAIAFRALRPINLRNYPDKRTRKKCRGKHGCGRVLPLSEFHKRKFSPDGRKYTCKSCSTAYTKRLYHKKRRENGR